MRFPLTTPSSAFSKRLNSRRGTIRLSRTVNGQSLRAVFAGWHVWSAVASSSSGSTLLRPHDPGTDQRRLGAPSPDHFDRPAVVPSSFMMTPATAPFAISQAPCHRAAPTLPCAHREHRRKLAVVTVCSTFVFEIKTQRLTLASRPAATDYRRTAELQRACLQRCAVGVHTVRSREPAASPPVAH